MKTYACDLQGTVTHLWQYPHVTKCRQAPSLNARKMPMFLILSEFSESSKIRLLFPAYLIRGPADTPMSNPAHFGIRAIFSLQLAIKPISPHCSHAPELFSVFPLPCLVLRFQLKSVKTVSKCPDHARPRLVCDAAREKSAAMFPSQGFRVGTATWITYLAPSQNGCRSGK